MNNTVSADIIKRVEDKILEVMTILQSRYPHVVMTIPSYSFRQMGRKGGLAYYSLAKMEFNSDFFKNHCEDMINQTIPHEIAHCIAYQVYGMAGKGHNRLWKNIMYALSSIGVKVTRCHEYNLEGVKTRKVLRPFIYACSCQKFTFTMNIHIKIQQGRRYTCRKCRHPISLLGCNLISQAA